MLMGCGSGPFQRGDRDERRLTVFPMRPLFASSNDQGAPDDMGAFDG